MLLCLNAHFHSVDWGINPPQKHSPLSCQDPLKSANCPSPPTPPHPSRFRQSRSQLKFPSCNFLVMIEESRFLFILFFVIECSRFWFIFYLKITTHTPTPLPPKKSPSSEILSGLLFSLFKNLLGGSLGLWVGGGCL